MDLKKFFSELKRREVYKVAIAYGITAWVIAQIAGLVSASFEFPSWVMRMTITILVVGFPIALILSWIFEVSSKGIVKTAPLESDGSDEHKLMDTRLVIGILVLIGILMTGGWWTWQKFGFDKSPPIRNLVVLPFDNYTGSDEYDYFVAGMHSSLITDIGRIGELTVKSKTTANSYKETDLSVPEIASELGIDAAVEGSITCLGKDSVCVQIRLISAYPKEQQLWVQDYRVEKSQILNFYNKVTKSISKEINIVLTPQEESLLAETQTVDPEAYDAYLMGQFYWDRLSKESLQMATDYFEIAIEKDPDWAPPHAGLASVWIGKMQMSFASPSIAIPKIYKNMNRALELDPNSAGSHSTNAAIAIWTEWDWDKGEKEYLKSIELNPNDALSRMFYAHLLMILKRPSEAIHQANLAMKLDPLRPLILGLGGVVMGGTGDVKSAIALYEKALSIDPNNRFANYGLSGAYRQIENYEKWFEYFKKIGWQDDKTLASVDSVFQEQGYSAAVEMTIKIDLEAANERYIDMDILGFRYLELHNYDKAMDYYEKAYEIHHPSMPYIGGLMKNYDKLKENPRYIELLQKMNLPLDDK